MMNDGEGESNDGSPGQCDIRACFDDDCEIVDTQVANQHGDDISYWVWHQATRIYTGTAASTIDLSIMLVECGMFLMVDDVSMIAGAFSSAPIQPTLTPTVTSTSTPMSTATPTAPQPSCSTIGNAQAPCFYITAHGDARIEGQKLGVELPLDDGTDEAYARFDIDPSIWWIDENQYLHVAEPLDRVTMTEYYTNEMWWEVFTMDHVEADSYSFQPSICSVLANGDLTCFQNGGIQNSFISVRDDYDVEDGVPGYNFAYWGGQGKILSICKCNVKLTVFLGSPAVGNALTLSTTVTECPVSCPDSVATPTPTPTPASWTTACDDPTVNGVAGAFTTSGQTFQLQCNTMPQSDRPYELVQVHTFGECINACALAIDSGCIGAYWSQLAADIHFGYPYCALVSMIQGPYQPYTGQHVALLGSAAVVTPDWSTACDDTTVSGNAGIYTTNSKGFSLECNTEPNTYRPQEVVSVYTFGECMNACTNDDWCVGAYFSKLPQFSYFGVPYCGLLSMVEGPYQTYTGMQLGLLIGQV
jgi:hypothetical protein